MVPTIEAFLARIRQNEPVTFQETMAVIEQYYHYSPARFVNGEGDDCLVNEPGMNEGSCRLFSFASLNCLTASETLALFGDYYRHDVLGNPEGSDHRNIRNFMKYGWAGIRFESEALAKRTGN